MTSPRNRRASSRDPQDGQSYPSGPSDRRMRQPKAQPVDRRMRRPDDPIARRKQRMVLVVGLSIVLVVAGIIGYGFYDQFVVPPRVQAARIGDTVYTRGDLVNRMRMMQAASNALGQPFDLGRTPFEILGNMAEAEMIRRRAPEFNIQVTDRDVELAILAQFFPPTREGEEFVEGQLEREYKENYRRFLDVSHISDKDHRKVLEENIYRTKLRAKLGEKVPTVGEQVEVQWILVPAEGEGLPGGSTQQSRNPPPGVIRQRLDNEIFADVARQANADKTYANPDGYVGWVPKGAFTSLDETLFGSDEAEPITHNLVSQPISSPGGHYIVKVTAGPEVKEISEPMRERLKDQALEQWLFKEKEIGVEEGWWEVKFNSEIYSWVIDQVQQASPRTTEEPEQGLPPGLPGV